MRVRSRVVPTRSRSASTRSSRWLTRSSAANRSSLDTPGGGGDGCAGGCAGACRGAWVGAWVGAGARVTRARPRGGVGEVPDGADVCTGGSVLSFDIRDANPTKKARITIGVRPCRSPRNGFPAPYPRHRHRGLPRVGVAPAGRWQYGPRPAAMTVPDTTASADRLGRSQAVRQRFLVPPCAGSNPAAPAKPPPKSPVLVRAPSPRPNPVGDPHRAGLRSTAAIGRARPAPFARTA